MHAVLVLEPGIDLNAIVRDTNTQVQDHQRIRSASIWPADTLPRTAGTRKLKRAAIRDWVAGGEQPLKTEGPGTLETLIARFAGGHDAR